LRKAADLLDISPTIAEANDIADFSWEEPKINLLNMRNIDPASLSPGKPNAMTGRAMIEYAESAVRLAVEGRIEGAVGGPHSKKAAKDAGYEFDGYPGFVAKQTGSRNPFLLLVAGKLRVANTTLHVALRDAVDLIKEDLVLTCITETHRAIRELGISEPRIAVAGLNPHAGEERMFGDEDADEIAPAVERARASGIDARGPFPADSLFYNAMEAKYDGYVGMYHDQAHMPVKTLAFRRTSALVIGVPINWATVGHGCALDIAWQRQADAGVLVETLKLVSRRALARRDRTAGFHAKTPL
jgi:4-hydroxythreonine-4-phosphate dehydrogenase